MIGKSVDKRAFGECATFSKTISESDTCLFEGITGDFNPVHINQPYSEKTFYKARIAHGILAAGLLSVVVANQLPGPKTVVIDQALDFTAPVYFGDTVAARVEILSIDVMLAESRPIQRT